MTDINLDILKTAAGISRKIALELYSLEDDSELRAIFERVGGLTAHLRYGTFGTLTFPALVQIILF